MSRAAGRISPGRGNGMTDAYWRGVEARRMGMAFSDGDGSIEWARGWDAEHRRILARDRAHGQDPWGAEYDEPAAGMLEAHHST
jgi:hypothetical protein